MSDVNEPMRVMRCRVCDALLKAENIDFGRRMASCGYCKAVMRFEVDGETAGPRERPEMALPERFTVEDLGAEFRITWRWFTYKALFLVFFCVIWCGFLVFWYGMGVAIGAPIIMFIFPLLHVAVGVGLSYYCLCMFMNTTRVTVARGRLSIMHGPLPWPGGGTYDADDLQQFYCEHKEHHGKNGTTHAYSVKAKSQGGRRITLIKGLDEPNKALFIEQQLERHLGIEDGVVAGELPRS